MGDEWKVMMQELMKEIKKLGKDVEKMRAEFRGDIKKVRKEEDKMSEEYNNAEKISMIASEEEWKMEKEAVVNRVEIMEEDLEKKERAKRKNNVVVKGLKIEGPNKEEKVERWMKQKIGVNVKVKEVIGINGLEMMCLTLGKWEEKIELMKRKSKLREEIQARIYIDNDLTKKEREIQRKINERARTEKSQRKTVKIGYKKIQIERECWNWDEKEEKLIKKGRQNEITKGNTVEARERKWTEKGGNEKEMDRRLGRNKTIMDGEGE